MDVISNLFSLVVKNCVMLTCYCTFHKINSDSASRVRLMIPISWRSVSLAELTGFNLTVELPLKAIARGYSYAVLSNNWYNRKEGLSKFKIDEVAGGYLFIIFYCWLERRLSNKGQIDHGQHRKSHLQVWHR